MKRLLITILSIAVLFSSAQDRLSIGLGSNGIGASFQGKINSKFSIGSSATVLALQGSMQNSVLDNILSTRFRTSTLLVEGFAKWQANKRMFVKGGLAYNHSPVYRAHSTFYEKVLIGSFELNKDQVGVVNTTVRTNRIQPFIGMGYSVINNKKWFLDLEGGVFFHGRPSTTMDATGVLHLNDENEATIRRLITPYFFFPLLKIETGIKINHY